MDEHIYYGERVRERLRETNLTGRLDGADGTGTSGDVGCGSLVRFDLKLEGAEVAAARFQAYGCPATIAAAAELAAAAQAQELLTVAALSEDLIGDRIQLPAARRASARAVVDAFHLALEDAMRGAGEVGERPGGPEGQAKLGAAPARRRRPDRSAVLVGMSGGVDSSVAALELKRLGFRVVGVTFRLWTDPECPASSGCCSPEGILTARSVAHQLGLPHLTVDLTAPFYEQVVEYFVDEYARSRTPNPCVRCNAVLRFPALAAVADRLGIHWLATGHYAHVAAAAPFLRRGAEREKDQSYVLAEVAPALLARTRLALGDLTKAEVRRLAREAGLTVHDAPESQEICFIPDDNYRRFLRRRLGEQAGPIVDAGGRVLGTHRGTYNFTVGQRRGLGLALGEPVFVTELRPEERAVVIGSGPEAEVQEITVENPVRHLARLPSQASAQLRSSGRTVTAKIRDYSEWVELELEERVRGVAPGQAAVLYEGEAVVMAGCISQTKR